MFTGPLTFLTPHLTGRTCKNANVYAGPNGLTAPAPWKGPSGGRALAAFHVVPASPLSFTRSTRQHTLAAFHCGLTWLTPPSQGHLSKPRQGCATLRSPKTLGYPIQRFTCSTH